MKNLILLITILTNIGCQYEIYKDENGIIKCSKDTPIGFIGKVDGVSYKVVDSIMLYKMVEKKGDLRFICTSKITNMSKLFMEFPLNGLPQTISDISNWDVSNVTDMSGMFSGTNLYKTKFNGDVSNWDVSNVTDMSRMFGNSNFNGNISNWDVSNVTDMSWMFNESPFNGNISNWDVGNVTDTRKMFSESTFSRDISNWDVSNVTKMKDMFGKNSKLPQIYRPKFK